MENLDQQKRRKKPYKELIINGVYKDWKSFYEPNKEDIYKSIIEIFEEFKNTRKKSLVLKLSAKFRDSDWNTEFEFHRNETIVLKRDILPYFEENEDYEICSQVLNIHKELTL
jgi:hypothetical protein